LLVQSTILKKSAVEKEKAARIIIETKTLIEEVTREIANKAIINTDGTAKRIECLFSIESIFSSIIDSVVA